MDIDFVITWVDEKDPKWLEEKEYYAKREQAGDAREQRYRDWNTLKYWFRSVEKYAPWVRKVFFITYGHLPEWLNLVNPKLEVIRHSDFIPNKYLPTFSNRPIELNFHRIKDLSEHFVYFNDDMFLTQNVTEDIFFYKGLPCDTAVMTVYCLGQEDKKLKKKVPIEATRATPAFDMIPLNRNFDKNTVIKKNIFKWFNMKYGFEWIRTFLLLPWSSFPAMANYHLPYSYLKSVYNEIWEKEKEILDNACLHKFRQTCDINQWVMGYWQIASGRFYPRSPRIGKYFALSPNYNRNEEIFNAIRKQKYKMICLNDGDVKENFEIIKNELAKSFNAILPEKSSFEV